MSSPPTVESLQSQVAQLLLQNQQQAANYQNTVSNMSHEFSQLRAQVQAQAQQHAASSPSSSSLGIPSAGAFPRGNIDLKPMKPSTFHGMATSNGVQWLMEIERYFQVAGIVEADPRRSPLASTYLKDAASGWYTSVVEELGPSPSWTEFKEKFNLRFQPLAASKVARAALRVLKCRSKVAGYSQEFQRLMQQIPDMSVADQIEFYGGEPAASPDTAGSIAALRGHDRRVWIRSGRVAESGPRARTAADRIHVEEDAAGREELPGSRAGAARDRSRVA